MTLLPKKRVRVIVRNVHCEGSRTITLYGCDADEVIERLERMIQAQAGIEARAEEQEVQS